MSIKKLPVPKSLHLQWHITERCNLNCRHCYTEKKYLKNELSEEELYMVLNQYKDLLKIWEMPRRDTYLSITGGEPMLRKEFFPLLEKCHENRDLFRYNVMTNGMFINRNSARKLRELEVESVQLSIEGMKDQNDCIRGKGTFEKIIKAAEILKNENIHVSFSMTVHRENLKDLEGLVSLCLKTGIDVLGVGRLVPWGRGESLKGKLLEPDELRKLYGYVFRKNRELRENNKNLFITTGCSNSLWCSQDPGFTTHGCSVGYDCLTPMPNGDVLPCRRLPVRLGNVREKTLLEIWYESNKLWEMRNLSNYSEACRNCEHWERCRGGSRCVSYGYFGSMFAPDPQCWVKFKKLPERDFKDKINEKLKLNVKYLKNVPAEEEPAEMPFVEVEMKNIENFKIPKGKKTGISFRLYEEDLNERTGIRITDFLDKLRKSGVDLKITRPLPRCLFGHGYSDFLNKFAAPESCRDCASLFSLDGNGDVKFCGFPDKAGPNIRYMKNRDQLFEYFKTLHSQKKPPDKCRECLYYLRGDCSGLCFKS